MVNTMPDKMPDLDGFRMSESMPDKMSDRMFTVKLPEEKLDLDVLLEKNM